MPKINNVIQNSVMPVLLVITTVISIYNTIVSNRQDSLLKSLEITSRNLENNQKDIEFYRKFRFDLYNEVKTAITSKDSILQRATYEFVSQMLSDSTDDTFRNALLNTLKNSPSVSHSVRREIQENIKNQRQFKAEESGFFIRKSKSRFTVDIFYLEETQGISRPIAEKLKKELPKEYLVRVRVLPKLTNTKPGYQVGGNEIRYEPAESSDAQKIVDIAGNVHIPLNMQPINYKRPNYISIFIKDGSPDRSEERMPDPDKLVE